MENLRIAIAFLLATVAGGTLCYGLLFFVAGGDVSNFSLHILFYSWLLCAVLIVLPASIVLFIFPNVSRPLLIAALWILLTALVDGFLRIGATRSLFETIHLTAAAAVGVLVAIVLYSAVAPGRPPK